MAMCLLVSVALAGCSRAPEPGRATDPVAAVEPAEAAASTKQTDADVDGANTLEALTARDVADAQLSGELACSFAAGATGPLLHATGVVASDTPAQAIVKLSGQVYPLRSPGGFSGLLDDPQFNGAGLQVRVDRTGPTIGGGESPPAPALLTYRGADGAERSIEGEWQCGP